MSKKIPFGIWLTGHCIAEGHAQDFHWIEKIGDSEIALIKAPNVLIRMLKSFMLGYEYKYIGLSDCE